VSNHQESHSAFDVTVWHRSSQSVDVLLIGELDLASAPQLRTCLAELTALGVHHVVADLTNLRFIDSSGIGVLVSELKRLRENGGSLVVRNAGPSTYPVFEMTGLVEYLTVTRLVEDPAATSIKMSAVPVVDGTDGEAFPTSIA
jgi:anti-sigma B factor antagonist